MPKFVQDDFVFGVQFVRGMTPPPESWDEDMRNIRKLGFNTIRVWLNWGTLEPRPGIIDYEWLGRLKTLAAKNHLRVVYLFHIHSAPEWAISAHRDAWYVNHEGRPFEPAIRSNTPSGGWPGLCPDHEITRLLEESFIERCVRFLGDSAFAYEPINEPHSWIDASSRPFKDFCYCTATRAKFRLWLQNRYQTLEGLSHAWGRPFASWEDVRPNTWNSGYIDKVDFRTFQMENIAGLVERRANVIRKFTARPVIAHAWGGGADTCSELGSMAFDDWKNAAALDAWGCSGFPCEASQLAPLGLSMDSTRSAAEGKPFWQSELTAGEPGYGFDNVDISPELLALFSWESASHGISGLLYWQWRLELYGPESMHFGLTDRAGRPTGRALAVAKVGKVLTDNSRLMLAARPPQAEIAILFHPRAILMDHAMHGNCTNTTDALMGYYRAMWDKDIPVDILHTERITAKKLAQYKLLVLPAGYLMSQELAELLKGYVAQGGTLLADPMTASWDENTRMEPAMPGRGLDKVFGANECKFWTAPNAKFSLATSKGSFELEGSYIFQTWRPLGKATAYAMDKAGQVFIVRNTYGKGKAFILGVTLGNMYSKRASISDDIKRKETAAVPDAGRLFCDIVREAGIQIPEADDTIRFHRLLLPKGRELHFYLNQSEEAAPCKLHAPGKSLISKKKVTTSVSLGKYGVEMLLIH
ncbi:MAG: beta-galactosidase [Victivallales bacterium]|nr:beta-galactosidase [Victivallales bacterium]